jgi:GAF domain-containing protein
LHSFQYAITLFQRLELPLPEHTDVLRSGAPRIVSDLQHDQHSTIRSLAADLHLRSVLRLPLSHQQQVIGILEIYTNAPHTFYDGQVTTLEMFAAKAAMAIVNSRLAEQNQDQIRRLKMLADIVSSITSCIDHEMLFDRVVHKAAALVNAEDCSIFWIDPEQQTIDLKASHRLPDTPSSSACRVSVIRRKRVCRPTWQPLASRSILLATPTKTIQPGMENSLTIWSICPRSAVHR